MFSEKTKVKKDFRQKISEIKDLVLFNDDFNTFDFVIDTLIDLCKHDSLQAEQCALIVHFNGQCVIKSANFEELKPIWDEMTRRGLSAEIK